MRNASLFSFVIPWLFVFAFFAGVYFLLNKFLFSESLAGEANSSVDKEIMSHSSDRMGNGETYWQGCAWLYEAILGGAWFSVFRDVNEAEVGDYLLRISKAEYKQLEVTFRLYKEGQSWMYRHSPLTLSDYLRGCMNSTEQKQYLTHLGIFIES